MKIASIFTNGMVLQQGIPVPVWGSASPGSTITVRFGGQQVSGTADNDGNWMVRLAPLTASNKPAVLEVSASDGATLSISDILVGEVWVCSGQSNMEWPLKSSLNGVGEFQRADFQEIRLFTVPRRPSGLAETSVTGASWCACSPATAAGFSAVAYYFGRELHSRLNIPVGLIHTSWGGTPAEAWTRWDALEENPVTRGILETFERDPEVLASRQKAWRIAWEAMEERTRDKGNTKHAEGWAAMEEPQAGWKEMELPGVWQSHGCNFSGILWFRKTIEIPVAWAGKELQLAIGATDKSDTTYFNNERVGGITMAEREDSWSHLRTYTVPGELVRAGRNVIAVRVHSDKFAGGMTGPAEFMQLTCPDRPGDAAISLAGTWRYAVETDYGFVQVPEEPLGPEHCNAPGALFNGMISPLLPFAIRGAIWYQGESNVPRAAQYRTLFQVLIRNWREAWGQGDFPFYFVQLANFMARQEQPGESKWAELREAQTMALALPNTGMAVTIDIGEAGDIHPRNKKDVGLRLALNALHGTYGHTDVIPCGPLFRSAKREGSSLRISFDHADGGLVCRGDVLRGFAVAGEDGRFVWADAKIDGEEILVSSSEVAEPRSARYGWDDNPEVNLHNKAGLPASPFRTDFP
ncbi:MAG: 9-O-acetylesterase [Verrucomicrobia bacterium]|nr:9-O-acetylesterase [Verrucomicrobiota bacterium]